MMAERLCDLDWVRGQLNASSIRCERLCDFDWERGQLNAWSIRCEPSEYIPGIACILSSE